MKKYISQYYLATFMGEIMKQTLNDSSSSLYMGSIRASGAINSTDVSGFFDNACIRLSVKICCIAVTM